VQVNKGNYRFVVRAGEAELPLSVTVSSQGTFKTEFTTSQPNMKGNAKSNFNFNANLNNKTAETQLYALMAAAPRDGNVIFRAGGKQATSAQWSRTLRRTLVLRSRRPQCRGGTYKIPVQATTGTTSDELELEV
jgi:uncharacterized membrane protein